MKRAALASVFALALAVAAADERARIGFDFDPETVARTFRPFAPDVSVRWDDEYFYLIPYYLHPRLT